MSMWGSAIDPTLAEKYDLGDQPNEGHNLPPHPSAGAEQTKHHPKPTVHLPDDHASQTGEATRVAFPTDNKEGTATETGVPTSFPTAADEGIFNNMYDLLANQFWLIGAFGVVIIFGAAAGIFFWLRKRRVRRARSAYAPLPGADSMPMRSLDRAGVPPAGSGAPGAGERSAGGTRELYDAFGVGSDEEDEGEVDENSALTGAGRFGQAAAPLTYHDGFLDDNGMSSARTAGTPYRDDVPAAAAGITTATAVASPPRPGSDGSGDGSWQDAAADHEAAPLRP